MKVLITGGSSLLGKYLHDTTPAGIRADYTWYSHYCPWTRHHLDVTDPDQVAYVMGKIKPEAIIHMAAIGSVDWAQQNYRPAWDVNVEGTRHILEAARDLGARVLLTSSNAVFSGEDPPYREDSELAPVNAYGKIRVQNERIVMKEQNYQIVRLFLLYGWEPEGARGNWASSAFRKLSDGQKLRVVDDRWYMPTYAADAARAIWSLLDQGQSGVYHVAGDDRVTLHDFVATVAEQWQFPQSLVEPCPFAGLGIAPRPVDTTYDLSKLHALGIHCRGIREGVEAMWQEQQSYHA
jgi:dTDP-4-dehydrorhamnose reductase